MMTDKELLELIDAVKDAPEFGGDPDGSRAARCWTRIATELGFENKTLSKTPPSFGIGAYLDFFTWRLGQSVLQPAAAFISAFVLILGGWTATVNAAHSVPGDVLYPVKLAGERMRLSFTNTAAQRVVLQAEYAGRRAQEAAEIALSDNSPQKETHLQKAVTNFKNQIANVNADLVEISHETPEAAVASALIVDGRTSEYQSALSQSGETAPEAIKQDVQNALEGVADAQSQVRETLVADTESESSGDDRSGETLKQNFRKQYSALATRIALSLGRLAVIESVLVDHGGATAEETSAIRVARESVALHDKTLREAMDILAQGGFRRSFELLDGVDAHVRESEGIITDLEIRMTTRVKQFDTPDTLTPGPISGSF